MPARSSRLSVALLVLSILVACGRSESAQGPGGSGEGALSGTVEVFAAASLTESFTAIGRRFEAAHPGARVSFNFGASSALAHQIRNGAPADVLATADEVSMHEVLDARLARPPRVFARNRLAVLVAKGNPKRIGSLPDLARPGLTLVLCAPEVPCGRMAADALAVAGVAARPRSFEPNVKAVASKVVLGEADAGIVYATDVRAVAGKAEGVDIPAEHNTVTSYPIAVLHGARNGRLGEAFVDFVLSDAGREVLSRAGFEPG